MTRKPSTSRTRKSAPTRLQAARAIAMSAIGQVRKTRDAMMDRAAEAQEAAVARAGEAKTKTVKAVSQLEKLFENRVSIVISKLGVPTTKDVRALSRQVAQLQASVEQLRRSRARSRAA